MDYKLQVGGQLEIDSTYGQGNELNEEVDINQNNQVHLQNENHDDSSDLKKICELKEFFQLGENRKKVIKCFNNLYCTKGDNLTNSLIEIFSIDINSDTILYILQKYMHMHGLCIPCYKFTNDKNSCEYNIKCKWCHHYSHLNRSSGLYPNKILHAKNKCYACTHFIKGRLCLSQSECKFCHSFDHLPIHLKTKYYNILNTLYKKKMNTNIINKNILKKMKKSMIKENTYHPTFYVLDKDLMNIFYENEKNSKNNEENNQNNYKQNLKEELTNTIPENNIIYDQNNKKKKITIQHTCNECNQNKKPCLNYFLSLKDCQNNCNDCHDDIHKNKFSNLYFLTYMHNNNICNVCPFINEERCNCDQTTTYCHDTDHISFDIKFKNSINVSSQYLQTQFLYKKEKEVTEIANEQDGYVSNANDASLVESDNTSNIDAHDDNNTLEKEEPKT
ncbi:centrosomal protein CEP120, putative [Plasmodium berghei]|uniref:Centrosomal protein CEP120, putative n=2 Tax=Plasmodium berghei TaxID=5821 RepID=A0A509ALK2_PLABA|nr:centrosomal protein CEP120, putative [Plasmodium berghei ANKA]CXI59884.1 centrosomal protein CEP120, putative [Plasmodium berghei]SCM23507.1 centrosomal protein CEP120, putative [Plasmodium berghei]SCN26625.1 centrosomal protein CEP120, putative [Plasmodium berghei]SCO60891.1 centrosomal protein CEP120, putative [Plasmodium berghei]SCO62906.1 centrosomal protein CEP120, putative [Plasmodium berghei]|eukprot:XP_034422252.1 centrosomal protein CEP120, putative [Plasmodium berghei ANKA]